MTEQTESFKTGKWVGDIVAARSDGYSAEAHAHAEEVARFFAEDDFFFPAFVDGPGQTISVTASEQSPEIIDARRGVAAAFEEKLDLVGEGQ